MTIAGSRPVPDTADLVTLTAVPEGKVAIRALVREEGFPEVLSVRVIRGQKQRPGEAAKFTLVRRLGPEEGLFAADATPGGGAKDLLHIALDSSTHAVGSSFASLDLRGGTLNFVDLRPQRGAIRRVVHEMSGATGVPAVREALRAALRDGTLKDLPPEIRAALEEEPKSER